MINLKKTRNIIITGLACACFLCACTQPQESLQGFSEDGTLEAADSAKEIQQTDITYDELLQSCENHGINYPLNEPFDSFLWDCTGLYGKDGITSLKQSFMHTVNQIAELMYEEYNTENFSDQLYEGFVSDDARIISKVFEIFESVTGFDFESDFSAEFVFGMNEEGETRYFEFSARQDMDKYSLGLRINEFGSSYIELDGTDELIIENKDVTGSIEITMPKTDMNMKIDYTLHLGDGFKRQGNSLLSGKAYIEGIFVGEIALTNDALYFDFNLDPYIGSIIDGFGGGAVFRGGTEGFVLGYGIIDKSFIGKREIPLFHK